MREKYKYASDASTPAEADEVLRRLAAERLADHLEIGISLAGHCEMLAGKTKGDRLGPVYAAARLMQANAAVAEALVNVAQIERRRRSIVERIQPLEPKKADLNSHFQEKKSTAEERLKLVKNVEALLAQMARSRTIDEGEKARLARIAEEQLSAIEALPGEEADEDLGDNAS
jgi:hypothetical protein